MKLQSLATAAVLSMFAIMPATAADLGAPIPPPGRGYGVQEFGSGWYLRGDVGYMSYTKPSIDWLSSGTITATATSPTIDPSWVVGLGGGFKSGWFRSDVTVDYRAAADARGTFGARTVDGNLSALSILLNGYIDLGTWSGLTPYIGGGIGAAYLDANQWRLPDSTVFGRGTTWNLAWSLAGGLGIALGPHTVADFGYRYVNLGEPETGLRTAAGVSTNMRVNDLAAHEVRIGVRYTLD